jgi:alginate export protein
MYALLLWASLMSQATLAPASDLELPAYQKLRYDEDYSYLRDPAKRTDWFDRIKYIPLSEEGENYLSIGGLVRERYEYIHNPLWGEDPQDKRGVFLQRYMLHADLHLGKLARAFSQLQSAIESGRRGGPSPVDEDKLDFHQAFVDFSLELGEGRRLTLRGGRQEMFYGSSRLIDVRQGPNVRRSFDSVRALLKGGDWRIDGIAAQPVRNKDGISDNDTDHTQALWGIYGASKQNIIPGTSFDLYYLGFEDEEAEYVQGRDHEMRHSVGARLWGKTGGWDYNFEALYQWGRFGRGQIQAWTVASDTGYTWNEVRFHPRLGLRADIASGDRDPNDADLETFNPLFPRGNYFNELANLGPRNFYDVHPLLTLEVLEPLTLTADWNFYWRQSIKDGIYGPSGNLIRAPEGSRSRYVGSAISLTADWQMNRHLNLTMIYAHFFPGSFLRETGSAEPIDFIELTLSLTF